MDQTTKREKMGCEREGDDNGLLLFLYIGHATTMVAGLLGELGVYMVYKYGCVWENQKRWPPPPQPQNNGFM